MLLIGETGENWVNAIDTLAGVLLASEPRAELAAELAPFQPLIGSWDVTITWHDPEGPRVIQGEWHFGWALDGRAVADVWIAPSRAVREQTGDHTGEWGLTLRFYDPGIGAWRSTWLGPGRHVVFPFIGRLDGGQILLDGEFEPGLRTRWMFSDITATTFRWQNLDSADDGATWTLRQDMAATRMA